MKTAFFALPFIALPSRAVLVSTGDASGLTLGGPQSEEFLSFVQKFGRTYTSDAEEFALRSSLFHERLGEVNAHNARPHRRWTAGINYLADWTSEELAQLTGWRGKNRGGGGSAGGGFSLLEDNATSFTADDWNKEVDWRTLQMAKEVPEQGACGSCWAVATVVLLEAHTEIAFERQRSFSVQQLVNCVPNPEECGGQGGCKGATVELGMTYAQKRGLLETSKVPYTARDGKCKQPLAKESSLIWRGDAEPAGKEDAEQEGWIGIKTWQTLPQNKAQPLAAALLQGPVAISVGADTWHNYEGGIFDKCDKDTVINHAVVLFGMGKEHGDHYWLVRNSWGPDWGEKGYIRIFRSETAEKEDGDTCGTDHDPSKGVECKPYRESVTVCGMCGMLYDSVAVTMGKKSKSSR
eukprot:TRINITY_DN4195_c0_g1_i2.p1 TRINITY_DN4195_c0_g1~~TRINITY_DN4195_c0_g1_i2.p1  ORF type:complete len:408 (-),score=104.34 TRINITY_DN4195_c0_g1_i2:476-1699(-)